MCWISAKYLFTYTILFIANQSCGIIMNPVFTRITNVRIYHSKYTYHKNILSVSITGNNNTTQTVIICLVRISKY